MDTQIGEKIDQTYTPDSENAQSGKAVAEAVGEVKSDLDKLPNNETLIDNVAEVVKSEVPLVKSAEQPTFVNSVEECVDETKVYLLPDGNLYAYGQTTVTVTVETVDNETNLLPTATDESGTIYNEKGYKEQTSIENNVEYTDSSTCLTGFIPITPFILFLPIATLFAGSILLSIPPTSSNFIYPSEVISVTIKPTSSI